MNEETVSLNQMKRQFSNYHPGDKIPYYAIACGAVLKGHGERSAKNGMAVLFLKPMMT